MVLALCVSRPFANTTFNCPHAQHHIRLWLHIILWLKPLSSFTQCCHRVIVGFHPRYKHYRSSQPHCPGALGTSPPQRMEPFGLIIITPHSMVEANRDEGRKSAKTQLIHNQLMKDMVLLVLILHPPLGSFRHINPHLNGCQILPHTRVFVSVFVIFPPPSHPVPHCFSIPAFRNLLLTVDPFVGDLCAVTRATL